MTDAVDAPGCSICSPYPPPSGWLGWKADGSRTRCYWCNRPDTRPPTCLYCDEPVDAGDIQWVPVARADHSADVAAVHAVCQLRAIVGGLNHQRGLCTCCGGSAPPDPPDMTRYEAAVAAVAYYRRLWVS